jgi:hypothetical protein
LVSLRWLSTTLCGRNLAPCTYWLHVRLDDPAEVLLVKHAATERSPAEPAAVDRAHLGQSASGVLRRQIPATSCTRAVAGLFVETY